MTRDESMREIQRAAFWLRAWQAFGRLRFAPEHLRQGSRRTREHSAAARVRLERAVEMRTALERRQ